MNRLQQGGTLLLPFWGAVQNKPLKRLLCVLYVCLQGIFFCGPLEADPLMPGNVRLECKDCGQMDVVVLKDDGGRSVTAGSEAQNGVGKSSTENGGSTRETFQPKQINAAKNSNQGRDNGKGPSRDISDKINEIIQAFLLGLILAAIPIFGVLTWDSKK